MPEGHTIHRIAREHRSHFVGDDVRVSSPQGRFVDAERLTGRALRAVEAYGKHLFYEFDGRRYVHVHLGLFGRVWTAAAAGASSTTDGSDAARGGRLVRRPDRSHPLPADRR